jgi:NlpC/P60 family putative phage cell wall peptidase
LGFCVAFGRAVIGPEPEQPDPYSPDWAEAGGSEALMQAAQRHLLPLSDCTFAGGDVLLFRFRKNVPAKHIGIATSATQMIHAHEGACVAEVPIVPFWRRRIAATFSFPRVEDLNS